MLIPVILSGGAGTRLWPVSREAHPKPFMRLPDGQGLLQKTLIRASALPDVKQVLTITNQDYFFQTNDEYNELMLGKDIDFTYILEPCARNTAPAITMAALAMSHIEGDDAVMLVLPADHLIDDHEMFAQSVQSAVKLAQKGKLVTFGIQPTRAETGYGYIQLGGVLSQDDKAYQVAQFVEKPDQKKAEQYLESGEYLWNSGMFCFTPKTFLQAVEKWSPDIYTTTRECWENSGKQVQPLKVERECFEKIPSDSIDYAVMEKADNVAVVACGFAWSDVGSWDAVSELSAVDEHGNRLEGDALLIDSQDCYVHSEDRMVAALGVKDLMIIDTPDALLVANRGHTQDVKKIVSELKNQEHESYRFHRTVHRPWGTYTVLEEGPRFKIKRIVVKPGSELSLQMHHHRSEHWIIVSGTAEVVNNDDRYLVHTNQSTYIPAGHRHRLGNPGIVDLVMIEVQSGEYLGEDDIVRFDDKYGRS